MDNTLLNAKQWFESMGFDVEIAVGSLYLHLEGCSVELSQREIEQRAEQWLNELNRED
jgi:hypothetical protein